MFYVCKFNFCPSNSYRDPNEDFDRDMVAIFSKYPEGNEQEIEHNAISSEFQISIVGKYDTLDEARTAFLALYPEHRAAGDSDVVTLSEAYDGLVNVFKSGKFEPLGPEGSLVWINDDMALDVTAATTDEDVEQLRVAYQQEANGAEKMLDEVVVDALRN